MTNELQTVGAMHQCKAGEPYSTCVHCGALAEALNKPCPHFMRDASQKLAAVTPTAQPAPAETMTLQEVWNAAGGNPGIKPTRDDVLLALKTLDEVCDEVGRAKAPAAGNWIAADDVNRLVRELDVCLNGEAGAAAQASLCDVVAQVRHEAAKRGQPLLAAPAATPQADSAQSAAPPDTVVLEASLRAIHQAIDLIGEPDTERLRTVRRVLRGAVVVAEDSLAPQADRQSAPIDMVLHCPKCGFQHIDAADPPITVLEATLRANPLAMPAPQRWTNPPHRSHLCHGCGHIWRPADVPTNGVAAVKTKGKADSPIAARAPADSVTAPAAGAVAGGTAGAEGQAPREGQRHGT